MKPNASTIQQTVVQNLLPAMLLVLTVTLSLSRAATGLSNPPDKVNAAPTAASSSSDMTAQVMDILQAELARVDQEIRNLQIEVDKLKLELNISDAELHDGQFISFHAEAVKLMQRELLEMRSAYRQMAALHLSLTNMTRSELRKALPTVSPDSLLASLLEDYSEAEQQMATLSERFSSNHPEVTSVQTLLDTINRQINDRLDGILLGLQSQVQSSRAALEQMEIDLEKAKQEDIERAIQVGPLINAKRELENLRMVQKRLQLRLEQDNLDRAIQRGR